MSVVVEGLGKRFWLQGPGPRTFQEALGRAVGALQRGRPFWALQDVSFRIASGESVGVVGDNGAGKSTLLRLVCGLGRPTRGRVQFTGRVGALLELGAGAHPHLTGRENLYVSAIVSGLRRRDVHRRVDDIVAFAEVEAFIDQPLRTWSSGMQVRLAFAVAMEVEPDVLVVDEVLAVGDAHFREKCLHRIEAFQQRGGTLLVVSHDLEMVGRLCHRAIHLEHGKVVRDGPAPDVTAAYYAGAAAAPGTS